MRTHTKETPYKCTECDKSFTRSSHLTVHMRMHTKETPYKCTVCDKAYTQSSSLTVHMKTHTGEKPFSCVWCAKTFARSIHQNQHMRRCNIYLQHIYMRTCTSDLQQSTNQMRPFHAMYQSDLYNSNLNESTEESPSSSELVTDKTFEFIVKEEYTE